MLSLSKLPSLFDIGYVFASSYLETLFTNVPIERTMNIILHPVYNEMLITTHLGPLLAGKTMAELVENLFENIIDDKILMFHTRYTDGTLAVIKPEHLDLLYDALNGF